MLTSTEQSFTVFSEEIGSIPANESREMKHADVSLSVRERMIVRLMGDGLSNKRIARQLSIAPETVKSHAKSIFLKLTVQTRAQAVYRAATLGLI
jgi:LuxR family maltose regulon positive regulatory protein